MNRLGREGSKWGQNRDERKRRDGPGRRSSVTRAAPTPTGSSLSAAIRLTPDAVVANKGCKMFGSRSAPREWGITCRPAHAPGGTPRHATPSSAKAKPWDPRHAALTAKHLAAVAPSLINIYICLSLTAEPAHFSSPTSPSKEFFPCRSSHPLLLSLSSPLLSPPSLYPALITRRCIS